MKAIQIRYKDAKINAALQEGVVNLILTVHNKEEEELVDLSVSGLEKPEENATIFSFYYWLQTKLEINDEIILKVIETNTITPPESIKKIAKEEF